MRLILRVQTVRVRYYGDWGGTLDACLTLALSIHSGDPRIPGTLHYQAADSLNDYEEAITAIGDALSSFNSTKEYPVWGFGAKFGGVVRHIFQCGPTSTVQGIDGVLEAYRTVFQSDLLMSGPTHFGQVIQAAALRARKYHESMSMCHRYCVLLIITDGMVDDVEETKRKLWVYKDMPLSVIIVGVGRAEFKGMKALCNHGTPATFVEFRQHQHDPLSMAKAALGELPQQIVDYMTANDI
jgi:Copine